MQQQQVKHHRNEERDRLVQRTKTGERPLMQQQRRNRARDRSTKVWSKLNYCDLAILSRQTLPSRARGPGLIDFLPLPPHSPYSKVSFYHRGPPKTTPVLP